MPSRDAGIGHLSRSESSPSAATTWVCSPHGTHVVQEDEPKGSCPEADRAYCVWSKVPEPPAARRCEDGGLYEGCDVCQRAPSAAYLRDVLDAYVEAADWYRRCLEDVIDRRTVRGLAEAKAGYDSALDAVRDLYDELGVFRGEARP